MLIALELEQPTVLFGTLLAAQSPSPPRPQRSTTRSPSTTSSDQDPPCPHKCSIGPNSRPLCTDIAQPVRRAFLPRIAGRCGIALGGVSIGRRGSPPLDASLQLPHDEVRTRPEHVCRLG